MIHIYTYMCTYLSLCSARGLRVPLEWTESKKSFCVLGRQVGPRARQVGPPRARLSAKLGHLRAVLCSLGGSWTTWPSNLAFELPNCSPKAVPSGSKRLPNLEKTMKNAVLSSIFEVRAVLHSKLSWTPLGVLLGANLDVLGVHLAASVTNLGPTWTLLGST